MADFKKLKKRTRLGNPPPPEAAGDNLSAPETAPLAPIVETQEAPPKATAKKNTRPKRETGRTEPLATRVTPEFKHRLRMIAARDDLKMVEVLELSIEAYEQARQVAH